MRRIILTSTMSLFFFLAPIGDFKANAMTGPSCGCGGSGATCQTNQRMIMAGLAAIGIYYHSTVLAPMASGKQWPIQTIVYTVGYGLPASLIYGAYSWWRTDAAPKGDTPAKRKEN